jgi:RNAse (barnase) inhibitor barstar
MIPFRFESHDAVAPDARLIFVPSGLENKEALLAFLARAVPFPDYFGYNWDALEECLADWGEKETPKIALVHQDIPLFNASTDQRIYLEILATAARDSKSLTVFFPPKYRPHISAILE